MIMRPLCTLIVHGSIMKFPVTIPRTLLSGSHEMQRCWPTSLTSSSSSSPLPKARLSSNRTESLTVCFSTSTVRGSGHNRWSKIRHEKGAADRKKQTERTRLAKLITWYTKMHGSGDVAQNTALAAACATAQRAGVPKSVVEAAISRGLGGGGRAGEDGKPVETVLVEGLSAAEATQPGQGGVGLLIEAETQSKGRVLQNVKALLKRYGATAQPTRYLFAYLGKIVLEPREDEAEASRPTTAAASQALEETDRNTITDVCLQDAHDELLVDVEMADEDTPGSDEDGTITVWTQPHGVTQLAQALREAPLQRYHLASIDLVYRPDAAMAVSLHAGQNPEAEEEDEALYTLEKLMVKLREEEPDLTTIYTNAQQGNLSDERWQRIQRLLEG